MREIDEKLTYEVDGLNGHWKVWPSLKKMSTLKRFFLLNGELPVRTGRELGGVYVENTENSTRIKYVSRARLKPLPRQ